MTTLLPEEQIIQIAESGKLQKDYALYREVRNDNLQSELNCGPTSYVRPEPLPPVSMPSWGYTGRGTVGYVPKTMRNVYAIADEAHALTGMDYTEAVAMVSQWFAEKKTIGEMQNWFRNQGIHLDNSKNYAFVDIETTGFAPVDNEIIEVAMIVTDSKGDEKKRLESLFNIANPVHREIGAIPGEEVHHIDYDTIKDLQTFEENIEFAQELAKTLNDPDTVIVPHNKKFENLWFAMFVDEYFAKHHRLKGGEGKVGEIDTMMVSVLYTDAERCRLLDLVESAGMEYKDAHRAMKDTEMTKEAFFKIVERFSA